MIYPPSFEQKIGFDQIRSLIRESCLSPMGIQQVDHMQFLSDPEEIIVLLNQAEEFRLILSERLEFPSQDYYDLVPELMRIRLEGTFLEAETLAELSLSADAILGILSFLGDDRNRRFPHLRALAKEIMVEKEIPKRIGRIIDDKARIRDDASPALRKIRKEKESKLLVVERRIVQSLRLAQQSGWAPPDASVSVRNGRPVIPMLSAHKRKIAGYIQDESATGQTLYIEPAEVFEINNEIRELEYADRREVIRILTEMADFIRPHIESLTRAYFFLGRIDFIRAKAVFALKVRGILPQKVHPEPLIRWNRALHPLLFLSHESQGKKVVPLDLRLEREGRILILSGPNAGGKSVCLKTAGLLQYMLQCGLLSPVAEDSEFGIFRKIFLDIGDEQSLENDLSTYTSKLLSIRKFLEQADEHSLFLMDELGSGTDPVLGGAIAEASLEALNEKMPFGIVTTHYPNLKLMSGRVPGILNGAMLFDSKKMKPLYQLKTGKPGSSFAFEIAREAGLPDEVLAKAALKTGKGPLDYEKQIQDLETEKSEVTKMSTEFRVADEFLQELIAKYERLKSDLEKSRHEILQQAKEEARSILEGSNRLIEKTVKEIRESQADKERTKKAREELKKETEKLAGEKKSTGQQVTPAPRDPGTT
ncbi:MAG TPA: hypothetical protein VMC08_01075, partial [Bacteroidales bacterium]|nr:hypothetical protein [Bacteroidales bacterium]